MEMALVEDIGRLGWNGDGEKGRFQIYVKGRANRT